MLLRESSRTCTYANVVERLKLACFYEWSFYEFKVA